MEKKRYYVAITGHNSTAEMHHVVKENYEEAVQVVHEHFLSYGFEVRDGKPYDPDRPYNPNYEGSAPFDNVVMYENRMVASFMHAEGDGPVGEVKESE